MIDLFAALLVGLLAFGGFKRGALISTTALVVAACGLALGSAPGIMMEREEIAAGGAVVGAMLMATIFALKVPAMVNRLREAYPSASVKLIDQVCGALTMALVSLAMVWVASVVIEESPGIKPAARQQVRASATVRMVTDIVPTDGALGRALVRSGLFPALRGPVIVVETPDPAILNVPAVRNVGRSVLHVSGIACNRRYVGTGWVVAPGLLVTNAHVVAGQRETTVNPDGLPTMYPAKVVAFDAHNDIAIMSAPGLHNQALTMNVAPEPAAPAAIVGYPKGGRLTYTAARYDRTITYDFVDVYQQNRARGELVLYRGLVVAGNSGSPLVDARGLVIGTVSSSALNQIDNGGYAVPNAVVQSLLAQRNMNGVSTGPCLGGSNLGVL